MEKLSLSFYTSSLKMTYMEAAGYRKSIALLLDKALRDTDTGKWVGGSYTKNVIEIFLTVNDYDRVLPIIKSVLKTHRLAPYMKIARQPK